MKPGRIIALVIGVLIILPAFGFLFGGGALTVAHLVEREDDGFFDESLDRLATPTAAISTEDVDLMADPGPSDWVFDFVDATVRIRATAADAEPLFLGIGPLTDVTAYLDGVGRDVIVDVGTGGEIVYERFAGTEPATAPVDQTFWVATASGLGQQELAWDVVEGEWIAVLMNADGSSGIVADVTVGVRSGAVLTIGVVLLAIGAILTAIAVVIIVAAARRPEAAEELRPIGEELEVARPAEPVALTAKLDEPLSPWLWLVKWILSIPHFIVLAFLWLAFAVVTILAFFAVLFTGRYPRGLFEFNLGVLRWTWRVDYYAFTGGLGTDRYPPFSLQRVDDYPATLDIAYPEQLSRGLVLVKWWLLAIPHYLVVAIMMGGDIAATGGIATMGLIGVLVIIAAATLLFTGRYPRSLFDLIIGLNRWVYRVIAYVTLMTDRYPPFRLDQGGSEPQGDLPPLLPLDDSTPEFAGKV